MKTTIILLTALLTLQVSVLFAGKHSDVIPGTKETPIVAVTSLAPVAPATATFDDASPAADLTALAPVTPSEATFSDEPATDNLSTFEPVIPAEADFE
jgi:hypothetical protein